MHMRSSQSEKDWKASRWMCVCGHLLSKHDGSSRCLVTPTGELTCPCTHFYSVVATEYMWPGGSRHK